MENIFDITQKICDKNFEAGCGVCSYFKYDELYELFYCEITDIEYSEGEDNEDYV
jgi:hypothetical protein